MKKIFFPILLFVLVLLTGCGTFEVIVETPEPGPPIFTDDPKPTATTTPEPFSYKDLPAGTLLDPILAGMVFRENQSIWVVDSQGQSRLIDESITNPVLSPDGMQVLYTSDDETVLWLRDLTTDESRILDETPDRMKRGYSWWPERPGVIVYALVDLLDPWSGTLGGLDLNTGSSFLLDSQSPTDYALSPDGETIALGARDNLRIYHWGGSTEYIVPKDFQLESWNFSSPSWSPDGTKLSLFGSRYNEAAVKTELIITVLDLQTKQSRTIYSYQANLGGEYPFSTSWSPDGKWISVTTFGELGGRLPALLILSANGSEKHQYPYGSGPIWSPDGSQLIYWQGPEPGAEDSSYLAYSLNHIAIGTWESKQIPVSPGSSPGDWVSIP